MVKCGCGRETRYTVGKDKNGEMILACNKYKRCPSYSELEALNAIRFQRITKLESALGKIASRGYNSDPYIELKKDSDIAKEALGI